MRILEWIQDNMKTQTMDVVMKKITSIGDYGLIWIIVSIILILSASKKKYGYIMVISFILCVLIGNAGLKPLVERVRPFEINKMIEILIAKPTDFSFPSGHTMSSFASAIILLYMDKRIGIFALLLAISIGFSRLYLFVHFPTDVLAGMVIGVIIGIISIKIWQYFEKNKMYI